MPSTPQLLYVLVQPLLTLQHELPHASQRAGAPLADRYQRFLHQLHSKGDQILEQECNRGDLAYAAFHKAALLQIPYLSGQSYLN